MDKPFDLTPFVKDFDLNISTGIKPIMSDGESLCFWQNQSQSIDINFTLENDFMRKTIIGETQHVVKMMQHGKYWFDKSFEADVLTENISILPDGSFTATYKSLNIIDLTNYHWTAILLRWIFRR